jgi:predicted esterase
MGFSQGAMLALDTALHNDDAPIGGAVLVSAS